MKTQVLRGLPAGLIATASMALACEAMAQQAAAPAQEPVTAVLKMKEVDFAYRSTRNYLSCDELINGVAVILRALGARDDVQVRTTNCTAGGVPDLTVTDNSTPWNNNPNSNWDRSTQQQSPMERMRGTTPRQNTTMHIWAMMPVIATPAVAKEMEQDKARRELVSRVTGNMSVALNDPILFAATRQEVTLSHETIKIEPQHCELLDQMISSVFRKLDLKVVRKNLSCDPHQRSSFPPSATVEALLPVGYVMPGSEKQKKKEEKQPEPAQSENSEQQPPQQ
jgi:hypothetical protein